MNRTRIDTNLKLVVIAVFCCVCLSGCDYTVPITAGPTRKIDRQLLGNWVSKDGNAQLRVRRLDESTYILSANGDLYRAFHSNIDSISFMSVQELESDDRKYSYIAYRLSKDGSRLFVWSVDARLIPKETKTSAEVQRLLKANLLNSELFGEETEYLKDN